MPVPMGWLPGLDTSGGGLTRALVHLLVSRVRTAGVREGCAAKRERTGAVASDAGQQNQANT
jgi:hypothetical protein